MTEAAGVRTVDGGYVIGPIQMTDWGDGLGLWNTVFAAGYPDWLIEEVTGKKLPTVPAEISGWRLIFTGRELVPVPPDFFDFWFKALHIPVSTQALRTKVEETLVDWGLGEPDVATGASQADVNMRYIWESGLFLVWPDHVMEAMLQPNPKAENPLSSVIPEEKWNHPFRMIGVGQLNQWWDGVNDRGVEAGFADVIQGIVREGYGWLVARPKASP